MPIFAISRSQNRSLKNSRSTLTTTAIIISTQTARSILWVPILLFYPIVLAVIEDVRSCVSTEDVRLILKNIRTLKETFADTPLRQAA